MYALPLAAALVAVGLAVCVTYGVRRAALRLGVLDCPDGQRKLQRQPVPLLGGIAVFLSALVVGLVLWSTGLATVSLQAATCLFVAAAICLLGTYDDLWPLKAHTKLAWQILFVLPLAWWGPPLTELTFGSVAIPLGIFGPLVLVGIVIGGMNAVNLLDGIDGLASLFGSLTCAGVAILAALLGRWELLLPAAVISGALLGFVLFNLPPARMYLGDSGSLSIGLVVTLMAVKVACLRPAQLEVALLVGLLALPLLDTSMAIARRWLSGHRPWRPDRSHLHHQILNRGYTVRQALAILLGSSAAVVGVTVASHLWQVEWPIWLAVLVVPTAWIVTRSCGYMELALALFRVRQAWQPSRDAAETIAHWRRTHQSETIAELELRTAALVQAAADGPLDQLDIAAGELPVEPTEVRHWQSEPRPVPQSKAVLEMKVRVQGPGWCHVRAVVRNAAQLSFRQWQVVLEQVAQCGQAWAEQAAPAPTLPLRVYEAPTPALRPHLVAPPQSSKAA